MIERSSRRTLGVAVAVTLALVACGDNLFGPNPDEVEFAASLGIDLADMTLTASGLYIRDDVVGEGELVAVGDEVILDYTGWLVNGTQFDTGTLGVPPKILTVGVTNLLSGFTEGILDMQLGGTRTIVIPASLAYGPQPPGTIIPIDAVLVFELTVTALVKA